MKRILPLILALCLVLSACGGKKAAPAKSPEELNAAYAEAIVAARDDELNSAFPIIAADDEMYEPVLGMLGIAPEDMTAGALVVSLRGVQAYSIIAVMPAEGKADVVREGLENYIELQKNNFQFYLEDQYQVAADAKLDTLADGTLLLVMCENQDAVFADIKAELEK